MSMEKNLKEFLEELIQEVEKELDEATATGAVAGYQTPMAFSDKGKSDKKRKKKIATSMGYSVVGNDVDNINEAVNESTVNEGFSNLKISGPAYDLWNDRKVQRKLRGVKIRIVGDMDGVLTVRGNDNELKKVKDINLCCIESVNEDKFYNTRVQYTDPKSKKKFVGDVVRKDGNEYKVNLGKDGRFEKYILAKAKDLKIVSKSTKRTFESVNEANTIGKMAKRYKNKDKFISAFFAHMKKNYGDSFPYTEKDKKYRDNIAKIWDYQHGVKESVNEAKVKRPVNRWLELKNDETMHPHKKMAMGLKELKYQLRETEKFFNWYNKIKTMNELDSNQYWKRTNKHIYSIKEKLINIAKTIQEIEK